MPLTELRLPFSIVNAQKVRARLARDHYSRQVDTWQRLEDSWKDFCKSENLPARLHQGENAAVGEPFWIEVELRNPLNTEITLSNFTLRVKDAATENESPEGVTIEVIDEITLHSKETRSMSITITSTKPLGLTITHASFNFLSILPCSESLSRRGPRLHTTPAQRQKPTYGPDIQTKVTVEKADRLLLANFVEEGQLDFIQGERKQLRLWFSNVGSKPIDELWLLTSNEDHVWVGSENVDEAAASIENIHSSNRIRSLMPQMIPLKETLAPDDNVQIPVLFHANLTGERELCLLVIYRETSNDSFHSIRINQAYEVRPLLSVSLLTRPSSIGDEMFTLDVSLSNLTDSTPFEITQLSVLSPSWTFKALLDNPIHGQNLPNQASRITLAANSWREGTGSTESVEFVKESLGNVLKGEAGGVSELPHLDLACSHISREGATRVSLQPLSMTGYLVQQERQCQVTKRLGVSFAHIPPSNYPIIFPLYNPFSVDVLVFWYIPTEHRAGHTLVTGLQMGAGHGELNDIILQSENAKSKRSMYAETQRERIELLEAARESEWNIETNPLVSILQHPDFIEHDFTKGPISVKVTFCLRNYSFTNPCRFILDLSKSLETPNFIGRLHFRGTLQPGESTSVYPRILITRPGQVGLEGWQLVTEVGEPGADTDSWKTRFSYKQNAPLPSPFISIRSINNPVV